MRLSLTPFDPQIHFTFQLKQYPIVISFVNTINKSQEISLMLTIVYTLSRINLYDVLFRGNYISWTCSFLSVFFDLLYCKGFNKRY